MKGENSSGDLSGNRLSESLALNGGTPMVTTLNYNASRQISNMGFTLNSSVNLTDDGRNTYT